MRFEKAACSIVLSCEGNQARMGEPFSVAIIAAGSMFIRESCVLESNPAPYKGSRQIICDAANMEVLSRVQSCPVCLASEGTLELDWI